MHEKYLLNIFITTFNYNSLINSFSKVPYNYIIALQFIFVNIFFKFFIYKIKCSNFLKSKHFIIKTYLSKLSTARNIIIEENNLYSSVREICCTNHTAAFNSAKFCRFEVCNKNYLLSDKVFRFVPRCNS